MKLPSPEFYSVGTKLRIVDNEGKEFNYCLSCFDGERFWAERTTEDEYMYQSPQELFNESRL